MKRILSLFKKTQTDEVEPRIDVGLGLESYTSAQDILDRMGNIHENLINKYDPSVLATYFTPEPDFEEHGRIVFTVNRNNIGRNEYLEILSELMPSVVCRESKSQWDELRETHGKNIPMNVNIHNYHAYNTIYDKYTARLDEYEKAFKNDSSLFLSDKFKPTILKLKGLDNPLLTTIINKYADPIHKILINTEKSMEVNQKVTEGIIEKSVEILRFFVDEIEQAEERIKELKLLEIEKINETMIADLDDEIKFVKNSIVQKHDWGIVK